MVTTRRLIPLTVLAVLAGCDSFYGPTISNGFQSEVQVTVVYSDGTVSRTTWPPCRTAFIGRKDQIAVRVSIEKDGKVLRELSASEIQTMLRKESEVHGPAQWSIGPSGSKLEFSTEVNDCSRP